MKTYKLLAAAIMCAASTTTLHADANRTTVLDPDNFKEYVTTLNNCDNELYRQYISNDSAWAFLKENIPFFECPDKEVEKTYYFRWWTFRKHIKQTPAGFIITEFLPNVRWAGIYNSINCPAGHHFYEGRWIKDNRYLNQYASFWFTEGNPRIYSFWAANALLEYFKVTGDTIVPALLPELIDNYHKWETGWKRGGKFIGRNSDGLFSMLDNYDGMEFQIGGSGKRPTLNSYMYGDAMAIAELADMKGDTDTRDKFKKDADRIKHLVETRLWDSEAEFFKTRSEKNDSLVDVRELQGYTPWYMNLPADNAGFEKAWAFLLKDTGFRAPYGPTTAERSHPKFQLHDNGPCMWDGRTWPFSTSVTLTALANLLNNYHQNIITPNDYFNEFVKYSRSQRLIDENGRIVPWVDESQNPYTGDWMTRSILKRRAANGQGEFNERGKDYNHSTYCDLLISGLVGVRPQSDNSVVINPLVPADVWPWFCLDGISYKGHDLTVLYDKDGKKYGKGQGLLIFVDGELKSQTPSIGKVKIDL